MTSLQLQILNVEAIYPYMPRLGPLNYVHLTLSSRIFVLHDTLFHRLNLQSQHAGEVTAECQIPSEKPETWMTGSPSVRCQYYKQHVWIGSSLPPHGPQLSLLVESPYILSQISTRDPSIEQ